jgi:hypothetical protein
VPLFILTDQNSAAAPRPRVCFEIKATDWQTGRQTDRQTDRHSGLTLQSQSWEEEPKQVPRLRILNSRSPKAGLSNIPPVQNFSIRDMTIWNTHISSTLTPRLSLRYAFFRDIPQRRVVIPYRRFRTTYRSHPSNLTLEDGTDRLSLNVGTESRLCAEQYLTGPQIPSTSQRQPETTDGPISDHEH